MKQFIKITITNFDSGQRLLSEIRDSLPEKWTYNEKLVRNYAAHTPIELEDVLAIQSPPISDRIANIWLLHRGDEISVINIVPDDTKFSLSYDEYNNIAQEFHNACLKGIPSYKDILVTETNPEMSIEDIAGKETSEKLQSWEKSCNHTTANLNPYDRDRWFDFVITAYKSQSKISDSTLYRWLAEDRGWPEDEILERLAHDFDYGKDLLDAYNRH